MEQVSELNFRFREDADSFSFVEETASNMHRFATYTCNDVARFNSHHNTRRGS